VRPFEWLPSLIAALSAFALGGLWYSPALFGRVWQREVGLTDEQLAGANKARIFGISFILCLVAAIAFSMVITPEASFFMAFHSGVGIGLFWVATSFGINYLFELKSLKLWLINAGYHTLQFTLYGLIFGLM
jgi:uncharacterized membrane protein